MTSSPLAMLAGLLGFLGVGLGAFGAHALDLDHRGQTLWSTASQYHLVHATVLLAVVAWQRAAPQAHLGWVGGAFFVGAVLFSGSLYALALGAPRLMGVVTPIGGVVWLVAWLGVAWQVRG